MIISTLNIKNDELVSSFERSWRDNAKDTSLNIWYCHHLLQRLQCEMLIERHLRLSCDFVLIFSSKSETFFKLLHRKYLVLEGKKEDCKLNSSLYLSSHTVVHLLEFQNVADKLYPSETEDTKKENINVCLEL